MKTGERIHELRIQKKLTLEELSNMVGVKKSAVWKWENEIVVNIKKDTILKLAEALNTTPTYIMGFNENEGYMERLAIPDIGKRIKERRIEKGITLKQIAGKLGVTEATAQRYECGNIKNIPYEYIGTYGKILNCSPAYLMGWDEDTMNKVYHIKLKIRDSTLESTIQAISKHEAIGKALEIVPTATYKDIIEIKEDT